MKIKIIFILLFIVTFAFGQEAEKQFEQANQVYRNGDYQKAAQMYEQIFTNGYEHPALYYNLGNAYYKQKEYPSAILNFERAKRLAPSDEDIDHNLHLADLHVIDKIEPVPQLFLIDWWRAAMNLFTTDGWAWLAISLLWGTVLLGSLLLVLRSELFRRLLLLTCTITLFLSIFSFIGMYQRNIFESEQFAIVFSQSVSVKSAPDPQSTDLFVLHEGVKAQVLDTVGDWKKIKLADGKIGWMQATGLQTI